MQFKSGEWVTDSGVQPVAQQAKPAGQPEKKMVAVLPFIEKEMEQVKSFIKRSHELSGQISRTIYLLPIKGLNTFGIPHHAANAFEEVNFIMDSEGKTSDWRGREKIRNAAGPNSLFRQASWFFYLQKVGPWLWLEPDCWPHTENWFYDLEQEYFNAGKPFMGAKMEIPGGNQYLNGVGIYPWNAVQHSAELITETMWQQHPEYEVGFDVAGGKEVLQKAHITRKIQLVGHLALGDLAIRPETVLSHGQIPLATDFLDGHGAAGEPQTEVFPDASPHAAPGVPSHETPVQEFTEVENPKRYQVQDGKMAEVDPSTTSATNPNWTTPQTKKDSDGYGGISKDIRHYVSELTRLWDNQPHRKVLIVKELRKAKLVPKHFR